jgi:hypothetical protein
VPTKHRARLRTPVEVAFACPSCGFAARAIVEGEGIGTATSFVILDRGHARDSAAEEALAEARHDAQVTASIAPCPRCMKRSRTAVMQYVVKSVFAVVGFLALAVVLWLLIHDGWRYLVSPLMIVAAAASAKRRRTRYELAGTMLQGIRPEAVLPRAQVRSLPPAPVSKPAPSPERIEPTPAGTEPRTLR